MCKRDLTFCSRHEKHFAKLVGVPTRQNLNHADDLMVSSPPAAGEASISPRHVTVACCLIYNSALLLLYFPFAFFFLFRHRQNARYKWSQSRLVTSPINNCLQKTARALSSISYIYQPSFHLQQLIFITISSFISDTIFIRVNSVRSVSSIIISRKLPTFFLTSISPMFTYNS